METIKIAMNIWIHSHAETSEPLCWDLLSITGEDIPASVIEYLMSKESDEDIDVFAPLEVEKPYLVIVTMDYESGDRDVGLNGGWYISKMDGYIEIPSENNS